MEISTWSSSAETPQMRENGGVWQMSFGPMRSKILFDSAKVCDHSRHVYN